MGDSETDYAEPRKVYQDKAIEKLIALEAFFDDIEKQVDAYGTALMTLAHDEAESDKHSEQMYQSVANLRTAREKAREMALHLNAALVHGSIATIFNLS